MGWKDAILSGLRSLTRNAAEEPATMSEEEVPQVSKATKATKATRVYQPEPVDVTFPSEHAMCALWKRWKKKDRCTGLSLSLRPGGNADRTTNAGLRRDARLVEVALTLEAKNRLEQLKQQEEDQTLGEQLFVAVSGDKMTAWIMLFPPSGGGKLSMDQIWSTLNRHGVVSGLDRQGVERELQKERYFQLIPAAFGTPPVHGENGAVFERYPRAAAEDGRVRDLGRADYLSLHLVQDVEEGDVICEIRLPTQGVLGITVTGVEIPAKDGEAAYVPQGRNTGLSEDGTLLVALKPGHVEFSGRNFQVKPVLEIAEDVDHTTGNINFLGDVHIRGDVRRGYTVRATGSIQVDGALEGCSVEAGEFLVVSSGVQGQDEAVLRAHKSVYAKYLEHCTVYARESVHADCIIDSEIYSNGVVTARTGRGVIIGGTTRAGREVSAVTVGSMAEKTTLIEVGGRPCESFERAELEQEVERTQAEIAKLEQEAVSPQRERDLSRLRLNLCVANLKLERFDKEMQARGEVEVRPRLVCDMVYPGTEVTIGQSTLQIEEEEYHCVIGAVNGHVRRFAN